MKVYAGNTKEYSSFALLKKAVFIECGRNITEEQIARNEYGKPYFNQSGMPYFSISHSGDFIVCVLSGSEIGIDIQKIREISDKTVSRFLHCESSDPVQRVIEWTKFESFGKMKGTGIPLNENYGTGTFLTSLKLTGYVLTVCSEKEDQTPELVFI